ncbi:hypothetical protein RFI_09886, partial [Reticulomyxa filosa]
QTQNKDKDKDKDKDKNKDKEKRASNSMSPSHLENGKNNGDVERSTKSAHKYKDRIMMDLNANPELKSLFSHVEMPQKATLPIKVGSKEILSLGEIEYKNPRYHTETLIFPVGFKVRQSLPSLQHKHKNTYYTAEIVRSAKATDHACDMPVYVITCEDYPVFRIEAKSSTSAWRQVTDQINAFTRGDTVLDVAPKSAEKSIEPKIKEAADPDADADTETETDVELESNAKKNEHSDPATKKEGPVDGASSEPINQASSTRYTYVITYIVICCLYETLL